MGWEEQKKLVQEGVVLGLLEDWIDIGFEQQAQIRGIDLEWHFWATVPPQEGMSETADINGSQLIGPV